MSDAPYPGIDAIVATAAHMFSVPEAQVRGQRRHRDITTVRHVAMSACHHAGWSYPTIAAAFDRDHTSVMHAVRKVAADTRLSEWADKVFHYAEVKTSLSTRVVPPRLVTFSTTEKVPGRCVNTPRRGHHLTRRR